MIHALRDRQSYVMLSTPPAHRHGRVPAIGRHVPRPAAAPEVDRLEEWQDHGALLALAGGHLERGDRAARIAREVELRAPAPAGASQGVISRFMSRAPFFRAPAAAWSARIEVPSTHQRSQSIACRRCIRASTAS
jgi:hypothetical protein